MTAPQIRDPKTPAPRPRDASTLVLYRTQGGVIENLMGERHAKHRFMPNTYVFPGGRVDRGDSRVPAASEMRDDVLARLTRGACTAARARALALAAVRETIEETGLKLAAPSGPIKAQLPAAWEPFFEGGVAPCLEGLDYVARAITPPIRPVRFNARFFMVDGDRAEGRLKGSGELLDLQWVPIDSARDLNSPKITAIMLGHVEELLRNRPAPDAATPVPLYRMVHGKRLVTSE